MIAIQFNKTFLLQINKDLSIRQIALPILKNKEAALRAEVGKIRMHIKTLEHKMNKRIASLGPMQRMWCEFPDIVGVKNITFIKKKIASVAVDVVDDVTFATESFGLFSNPPWFLQGVALIKEIILLKVEYLNQGKILEQIELARRKTTQKVNLYEKVQIPYLQEATRKIKRYLEDEENLSKSSQKILKGRLAETAHH